MSQDCCANFRAGEPAVCRKGYQVSQRGFGDWYDGQPQSYDNCPNYSCQPTGVYPTFATPGPADDQGDRWGYTTGGRPSGGYNDDCAAADASSPTGFNWKGGDGVCDEPYSADEQRPSYAGFDSESNCGDRGMDCCASQPDGEDASCAPGFAPSTQPQSYFPCPNYSCEPFPSDPRAPAAPTGTPNALCEAGTDCSDCGTCPYERMPGAYDGCDEHCAAVVETAVTVWLFLVFACIAGLVASFAGMFCCISSKQKQVRAAAPFPFFFRSLKKQLLRSTRAPSPPARRGSAAS